MAEIVDIAGRIANHFPIGGRPISLEVVPGATGEWVRGDQPAAVATIRLIVWDTDPEAGTTSVRDIKEQEINMGWPVFYEDEERVAAFFAALAKLLNVIAARGTDVVDALMPIDLMPVDALALTRVKTSDDFEAALRAKSRLGSLLG